MNDLASAMPAVGDMAPDFSLPDDMGALRTLSGARGRWIVLFFYPKDDTPGCTVESCEFRDAHAGFEGAGGEIWGISILGSDSKARFKAKFGLPFALLADEGHEVAERYGTWVLKRQQGRTWWGVQRATFLVDPQGGIRRVWPKVKPEGHAQEVLDALRDEQLGEGSVAPAGAGAG